MTLSIQQTKALHVLKNGGIIAYPTDTTYGVGCGISFDSSVKKIFTLKGRDNNKPMSIICSDINMAKDYADFSDIDLKLVHQLFLGPVTLLLKKKKTVSDLVTSGLPKVGIRIPNQKEVIEIVKELKQPIITTSANISGEADPVTHNQIKIEIGYILKGECKYKTPSTIIDMVDNKIVRFGADYKYFNELLSNNL